MQEVIKSILNKIKINDNDEILLDDKSIKINKNNFVEIQKINSNKSICFIDGGNLEILKSPSLSLSFNRIYATIYQKNKRIKNKLVEFFTLIFCENINGEIYFKTQNFFTKYHLNLKNYDFNSLDKKLMSQNKRAKISVIGNVIRRFAELKLASEVESDFIILDGSLEITYPYEKEILDNLPKNVYGLSKTNELLTRNGSSVNLILNNLKQGEWCYKLDEVCFLKLHKNSKYVFRFDFKDEENLKELICLLKINSKDPIFLGYPYGLVEADRFARVTNKEKDTLKLKLRLRFKEDYEKIEPLIKSLDAHDVLDSIG